MCCCAVPLCVVLGRDRGRDGGQGAISGVDILGRCCRAVGVGYVPRGEGGPGDANVIICVEAVVSFSNLIAAAALQLTLYIAILPRPWPPRCPSRSKRQRRDAPRSQARTACAPRSASCRRGRLHTAIVAMLLAVRCRYALVALRVRSDLRQLHDPSRGPSTTRIPARPLGTAALQILCSLERSLPRRRKVLALVLQLCQLIPQPPHLLPLLRHRRLD